MPECGVRDDGDEKLSTIAQELVESNGVRARQRPSGGLAAVGLTRIASTASPRRRQKTPAAESAAMRWVASRQGLGAATIRL